MWPTNVVGMLCSIISQQEVQMMTCLWLCMPVYFVWSQAFCLEAYWKWYNLHFIHLIAFVWEQFRFKWKEILKILRFIIFRYTKASIKSPWAFQNGVSWESFEYFPFNPTYQMVRKLFFKSHEIKFMNHNWKGRN